MNWRKLGSVLLAGCFLLLSIGGTTALANNAESLPITSKTSGGTVIVLDPGHGGTENGASAEWNGTTVYEKDLNAAIAKYCKQALENNYDGVTVYLTHTESETVSLSDRAGYAASVGADIMVSLHCNAAGDAQSWTDGAEALVPNGNYRSGLADTAERTATAILTSLHESTGIVNRGLIRRNSASSTYPNGKRADYYGLIRSATLQTSPAPLLSTRSLMMRAITPPISLTMTSCAPWARRTRRASRRRSGCRSCRTARRKTATRPLRMSARDSGTMTR